MVANSKIHASTVVATVNRVATVNKIATVNRVAMAVAVVAATANPKVAAAATTAVVEAAVTEVAVVATLTAADKATAVVPQVMAVLVAPPVMVVAAVAVVMVVVAARVVPSATKKTLSLSVDWEKPNSTTLNRYLCKITCSQCAFECSLTILASLRALPSSTLQTPTQRKKLASSTGVRQAQVVVEFALTQQAASPAHAEQPNKTKYIIYIEPKTQLSKHCTTLSLTT